MTRMSLLSSPLLLGFDEMERLIDRVGKGSERLPPLQHRADLRRRRERQLPRITLAVAGFKREQVEITLEDKQLVIGGGRRTTRAANTSIAASPRGSSERLSCWRMGSR